MAAQILLADNAGLAEAAFTILERVPDAPELVAISDGMEATVAFTKMAAGGRPPGLIAVDEVMPRIGGRGLIRAFRAIERAFNQPPAAVLIYSSIPADASMKAFLAEVGRAVHLVRPMDQPITEQARRFVLATRKLLAQVSQS